MNAAQIKTLVASMVDRIEWTDLRRGKMHVRVGDAVYLIDVSGVTQPDHLAYLVHEAPKYARNLVNVAGSRYAKTKERT